VRRRVAEGFGIAIVLAALVWPAAVAYPVAVPMPGPAEARPPSLLCDGTPPELINKDTVEHPYRLTCGKEVEEATIAPSASQSLEGKSGCVIELGDNEPTKLHTEMVCTITGGKLTCDLI